MAGDPESLLRKLSGIPGRKLVSPLLGALCLQEETQRWGAVTALGAVTDRLARDDAESGRVVVRQLMWRLNDESGGIGWGAPEAMGEILARNPLLRGEYAAILVSYLNPQGNFLELPALRRGAAWAVGRVAESDPEAMAPALPFLLSETSSPDSFLRGASARALGRLGKPEARNSLESLLGDPAPVRIRGNTRFDEKPVGQWAREALNALNGPTASSPV